MLNPLVVGRLSAEWLRRERVLVSCVASGPPSIGSVPSAGARTASPALWLWLAPSAGGLPAGWLPSVGARGVWEGAAAAAAAAQGASAGNPLAPSCRFERACSTWSPPSLSPAACPFAASTTALWAASSPDNQPRGLARPPLPAPLVPWCSWEVVPGGGELVGSAGPRGDVENLAAASTATSSVGAAGPLRREPDRDLCPRFIAFRSNVSSSVRRNLLISSPSWGLCKRLRVSPPISIGSPPSMACANSSNVARMDAFS
mmetsp:Transcript_18223/g.46270  ORF Transcript_18223/g.46270 Transcript_18223/m.46270 type:complete len:259 (+) Transcript_18223:1120-1896(+)